MKFALAFLAVALVAGAQAVTFEFVNLGSEEIWIGNLANPGHPVIGNGGFVLNPGQTIDFDAPYDWAGRFWGRTGCNHDTNQCETGDCASQLECNGAGGATPATLMEITLSPDGGLDVYDLSLVDGYNIRGSIEPIGGTGDGGQYSCKPAACHSDVNAGCPAELQVLNAAGRVIACNSACSVFQTDEYCCRGEEHGTPETCHSSDWPVDYPAYFKQQCPDAYSYAYDDNKSTFYCQNVPTYRITVGA